MANTRLNAAGTDVNRDHLTLASPEAFAIEQLVGRVQPDVLVDLHEFYGTNPTGTERFGGAAPVVYDEDAMVLWPRNLNVDPEIYALSKELVADVSASVRGGGYTVDDYGQYSLDEHNLVQIAGDGDEAILRNTGGLRNVVAMLIESSREPNLQRDAAEAVFANRLRQRRVQTHRLAIAGAVDFALARGTALPAATDAARSRAVAAGASQSVPVYFGGADNNDPKPESVANPPPCAYRLPTALTSSLSTKLAALSIATELSPLGDETSVTMAQPSRPLIPLVLDGRGVRASVAATPLYAC